MPAVLLAQTYVELSARYWMPDMKTRIRVESNGLGTDVDAKRDLGMSDEHFPAGSLTLQRGRHRLRFDYTPMDYSGDQTVTRTILYGGREYTIGTRVVSDLEVKHLQLSWAYQFIDVHKGAFRLGPLVEANGFLLKGTLAAPNLSTPFQRAEDLKAGIPTVGLAMNIQPHRAFEIYGQMSGMKVGDYGSFVNCDVGVKVIP